LGIGQDLSWRSFVQLYGGGGGLEVDGALLATEY
jgi:hypothetical protein